MPRESEFALAGTVMGLVGLLLPAIGDSHIFAVLGIIALLIAMGLFVFAALSGPRWWFGVFLCLVFASGLAAVVFLHQH